MFLIFKCFIYAACATGVTAIGLLSAYIGMHAGAVFQ